MESTGLSRLSSLFKLAIGQSLLKISPSSFLSFLPFKSHIYRDWVTAFLCGITDLDSLKKRGECWGILNRHFEQMADADSENRHLLQSFLPSINLMYFG